MVVARAHFVVVALCLRRRSLVKKALFTPSPKQMRVDPKEPVAVDAANVFVPLRLLPVAHAGSPSTTRPWATSSPHPSNPLTPHSTFFSLTSRLLPGNVELLELREGHYSSSFRRKNG